MAKRISDNGFTLIELAIVMVIIAVLAIGVLGGKDLLEISKRGKIVSDLKTYQIAFDQFKEKYEEMAGDISDATSYWENTQNGNGSNVIDDYATYEEVFLFWQHLGLSGFLATAYEGSSSGNELISFGENVPFGPYKKSGYGVRQMYADEGGWTVVVTLATTTNGTDFPRNVIPFKTVQDIDSKLDDGDGERGRITYSSGGNSTAILNWYFMKRMGIIPAAMILNNESNS